MISILLLRMYSRMGIRDTTYIQQKEPQLGTSRQEWLEMDFSEFMSGTRIKRSRIMISQFQGRLDLVMADSSYNIYYFLQ